MARGVLTLVAVLSASSVVAKDSCQQMCQDVKSNISPLTACTKFHKMLPRPVIGRFCQEGFAEAHGRLCETVCRAGGQSSGAVADKHMLEVCQKAASASPAGSCIQACEAGFDAGYHATVSTLKRRLTEQGPPPGEEQVTPFNTARKQAEKVAAAEATAALASQQAAREAANKLAGKQRADSAVFTGLDSDSGIIRAAGQAPKDGVPNTLAARPDIQARRVILSLPITVDEEQQRLDILQGDIPADVISKFCSKNMPDDIEACNEQLLSVVNERMPTEPQA